MRETVSVLHPISLVKGGMYRDKRGREWEIRAWLWDRGCWFEETEEDGATHLHAFDAKRKAGKFIRITSFAKSVVEQVCLT